MWYVRREPGAVLAEVNAVQRDEDGGDEVEDVFSSHSLLRSRDATRFGLRRWTGCCRVWNGRLPLLKGHARRFSCWDVGVFGEDVGMPQAQPGTGSWHGRALHWVIYRRVRGQQGGLRYPKSIDQAANPTPRMVSYKGCVCVCVSL